LKATANDQTSVFLFKQLRRILICRLLIPFHYNTLAEINELGTNGFPAGYFHQLYYLEFSFIDLRAAAFGYNKDGLFVGAHRFEVIALSFLDKRKTVLQRSGFNFKPFDIELLFLIVEVNSTHNFLGFELLYMQHSLRIDALRELLVGNLVGAIFKKRQYFVFRIKRAQVFAFLFGVQAAKLVVEP